MDRQAPTRGPAVQVNYDENSHVSVVRGRLVVA